MYALPFVVGAESTDVRPGQRTALSLCHRGLRPVFCSIGLLEPDQIDDREQGQKDTPQIQRSHLVYLSDILHDQSPGLADPGRTPRQHDP